MCIGQFKVQWINCRWSGFLGEWAFLAWLDLSWDDFFQWHGSLLANSKSSESIVDDQDFWENEHFLAWLDLSWNDFFQWHGPLFWKVHCILEHFLTWTHGSGHVPCYFRSTYIFLCDSHFIESVALELRTCADQVSFKKSFVIFVYKDEILIKQFSSLFTQKFTWG